MPADQSRGESTPGLRRQPESSPGNPLLRGQLEGAPGVMPVLMTKPVFDHGIDVGGGRKHSDPDESVVTLATRNSEETYGGRGVEGRVLTCSPNRAYCTCARGRSAPPGPTRRTRDATRKMPSLPRRVPWAVSGSGRPGLRRPWCVAWLLRAAACSLRRIQRDAPRRCCLRGRTYC